MKVVLFLMALPLLSFGQASGDDRVNYFDILGDMLAESKVPAIEDLLKSHQVGRCFSNSNDKQVDGSVVSFIKVNSDVGPIGDKYPEYAFRWGIDVNSKEYDDTPLESLRFDYLYDYSPMTGKGYLYDYLQYDFEVDESIEDQVKFGIYGEYLLLENNVEGALGVRCYFFNPGFSSSSSL